MDIRCSEAYHFTYIKINKCQREVLINMQNKMVKWCYKHVNEYYKTQCEKKLSNYILIFTIKFYIKTHNNTLVIGYILNLIVFLIKAIID